MEVLTAFIRENARLKQEEQGEREQSTRIRTDIQAALTVIGRRKPEFEQENQRLDLRNTDIRGALLDGANLEGALLDGANLQKASLIETKLQKAFLIEADLQEAVLVEANLQGAYLYEANLQGASFSGANLKETDLRLAKLEGTDLIGRNLESSQIKQAYGDSETSLPKNIKAPAHWTQLQ